MKARKKPLTLKFFQRCGSSGGRLSAARLTPEERKAHSQKMLESRWESRRKREGKTAAADVVVSAPSAKNRQEIMNKFRMSDTKCPVCRLFALPLNGKMQKLSISQTQ